MSRSPGTRSAAALALWLALGSPAAAREVPPPDVQLVAVESQASPGTTLVAEWPVGRLDEPVGGAGTLELAFLAVLPESPEDVTGSGLRVRDGRGNRWTLTVTRTRTRLTVETPDDDREALTAAVVHVARGLRFLGDPDADAPTPGARARLASLMFEASAEPERRLRHALVRQAWGRDDGASPSAWTVHAADDADMARVRERLASGPVRLAVAGGGADRARTLLGRRVALREPHRGAPREAPAGAASAPLRIPSPGVERLHAALPVVDGAEGLGSLAALELVARRLGLPDVTLAERGGFAGLPLAGDTLLVTFGGRPGARARSAVTRLPRLLSVVSRGVTDLGAARGARMAAAGLLDARRPADVCHLALDLWHLTTVEGPVDVQQQRDALLEVSGDTVRRCAALLGDRASFLVVGDASSPAAAPELDGAAVLSHVRATSAEDDRAAADGRELLARIETTCFGGRLPAPPPAALTAVEELASSGAGPVVFRLDLALLPERAVRLEVRRPSAPPRVLVLRHGRDDGSSAAARLTWVEAWSLPGALALLVHHGAADVRHRGQVVPACGPDGRGTCRVVEVVVPDVGLRELHVGSPPLAGFARATLVGGGAATGRILGPLSSTAQRRQAWAESVEVDAIRTAGDDVAVDTAGATGAAWSWAAPP